MQQDRAKPRLGMKAQGQRVHGGTGALQGLCVAKPDKSMGQRGGCAMGTKLQVAQAATGMQGTQFWVRAGAGAEAPVQVHPAPIPPRASPQSHRGSEGDAGPCGSQLTSFN